MSPSHFATAFAVAVIAVSPSPAADPPPAYAAPMRKVVAKFDGRPGVVIHVGDSITYANPYGQWARAGAGQTDADKAVLKWMHTGADDDTDGWYLARFDHPAGGRSHTACGGIRADELRRGGKQGMLGYAQLLDRYKPQLAVLMVGTNDASADRPRRSYLADISAMLTSTIDRGVVPVITTIPPHPGKRKLAASYNDGLRELATARGIPLIDYEREILARRKDDWDGTLLGKGDVHPSVGAGGATPTSAPTPENLANSGYLLRGWLTVQKIAEVKRTVFDRAKPNGP